MEWQVYNNNLACAIISMIVGANALQSGLCLECQLKRSHDTFVLGVPIRMTDYFYLLIHEKGLWSSELGGEALKFRENRVWHEIESIFALLPILFLKKVENKMHFLSRMLLFIQNTLCFVIFLCNYISWNAFYFNTNTLITSNDLALFLLIDYFCALQVYLF